MTKICCICNKKEKANDWTTDFIVGEHEMVTHGYCPHCFDEVMVEINDFMATDRLAENSCQCNSSVY